MDSKVTKYQLRYLQREISGTRFELTSSELGAIELRLRNKTHLEDYYILAYALFGIAGLVFSFIEELEPLFYILSGTFLLVAIGAFIVGIKRQENQFFRFDPMLQTIEYCTGSGVERRTIASDDSVGIRCELDEYGGRHRHYSATFYARTAPLKKDHIILQINSAQLSECERFAKAVSRYLLEMSALEEITMNVNHRQRRSSNLPRKRKWL